MRYAQASNRPRLIAGCSLAVIAAVCAAALSGCNKTQTADAPPLAPLPLASGTAPASAPAPAALPQAPPVRYARLRSSDRYAYPDRAFALSYAFGDAPPDYTYDYRGERPWVWRTDDGYERFAERLPDGRLRYYYYAPGSNEPYLIQDPDYAYGYSDGELTGVYDADGQALADQAAEARAAQAGRYFAWAAALYAAANVDQHVPVYEDNWRRERQGIYDDRLRWQEAQDHNVAWAAYHDAHQAENEAHWADEQARRADQAASFARSVNDAAALQRAQQIRQQAVAVAARTGQAPPPAGQGPGAPHAGGPFGFLRGAARPQEAAGPTQAQTPPAFARSAPAAVAGPQPFRGEGPAQGAANRPAGGDLGGRPGAAPAFAQARVEPRSAPAAGPDRQTGFEPRRSQERAFEPSRAAPPQQHAPEAFDRAARLQEPAGAEPAAHAPRFEHQPERTEALRAPPPRAEAPAFHATAPRAEPPRAEPPRAEAPRPEAPRPQPQAAHAAPPPRAPSAPPHAEHGGPDDHGHHEHP